MWANLIRVRVRVPDNPADDNEQQRAARNILLDQAIPTMDQLDQRKKLANLIMEHVS